MDTDKFYIGNITLEEVDLKGEKQAIVSGYISTDEIDSALEIVTPDAMKGMVEQLSTGAIKLDFEHETFRGKADIPIGRIMEAKLVEENGKNKIWVKAVLNRSHSRFSEIWSSIKDGFIDAFSIAYKARDKVSQTVQGMNVTLLKTIDLLNVALTGNPVNKGCRMTEAFMKSRVALIQEGEHRMTEQEQATVAPVEVAPVSVDLGAELKSRDEAIQKLQETIEATTTALKSNQETIDKQAAEIAELKAMLEKPVLKSAEVPKDNTPAPIKLTPLALIG